MTPRPIDAATRDSSPAVARLAKAIGDDIDPAIVASAASMALVDGRRRELGLELDAFTERVVVDREECDRLRRQIVPAETWFFRYPASFEHLRSVASARGRTSPIRVASLGCATGAEPFSIAAALDSFPHVEVIAVDRDSAALEIARGGRLGESSIRGAIPGWARGGLRVEERRVIVEPRWRERVQFMEHDLLDPALRAQLGAMDAVFCRNVAIYLGAEARRRLGALASAILRPGGWLYLGHAEMASSLGLDWQVRDAAAFAAQAPIAGATTSARPQVDEREVARATGRIAPAAGPTPGGSQQAMRFGEARIPGRTTDRGAGTHGAGSPAPRSPSIDAIRRAADEGRHREALAWSEAAFERGERSAELLEILGTLCLVSDRRDDARRHLRAALYLDPTREAASIQLALLSEGRDG